MVGAEIVVGYLIGGVLRKAKRVGGRLDGEVDQVLDAGLDRLHTVVAGKLAGHPALADLEQEAAETGEVTALTRQQVELAVTAAARKDDGFAQAVTELVARLRAIVQARAFGVVAGDVHIDHSHADDADDADHGYDPYDAPSSQPPGYGYTPPPGPDFPTDR